MGSSLPPRRQVRQQATGIRTRRDPRPQHHPTTQRMPALPPLAERGKPRDPGDPTADCRPWDRQNANCRRAGTGGRSKEPCPGWPVSTPVPPLRAQGRTPPRLRRHSRSPHRLPPTDPVSRPVRSDSRPARVMSVAARRVRRDGRGGSTGISGHLAYARSERPLRGSTPARQGRTPHKGATSRLSPRSRSSSDLLFRGSSRTVHGTRNII